MLVFITDVFHSHLTRYFTPGLSALVVKHIPDFLFRSWLTLIQAHMGGNHGEAPGGNQENGSIDAHL